MSQVTIKTIQNTLNRPDDYEVAVGNQEPLILDLDELRKLRDAICVMIGMPKRKKSEGR